jgi:hypothetical protein
MPLVMDLAAAEVDLATAEGSNARGAQAGAGDECA